ncbi:MAG: LysE family translocator [Alphaproteobacteria bacterium]|nr:LysE family translocator [Alphaproteobacteria bacterium]
MDAAILVSAVLAGGIVVLTPGPAVVALIGIGAAQGRRAGAGFILGHLAGDLLWSILALVALVGAHLIAPAVFQVLAVACGGYLLYLGTRSLLARRGPDGVAGARVERPLMRGLAFGLTNPKSYPVTLAIFTALLADKLEAFDATSAPALLAACFAGFLVADAILVWFVGLPPLRRLYLSHGVWLVRATGALFIGFAIVTLWDAFA